VDDVTVPPDIRIPDEIDDAFRRAVEEVNRYLGRMRRERSMARPARTVRSEQFYDGPGGEMIIA